MADTIEAKVIHRSPAKPEQVYDAWLEPAKVRRWMAASLKQSGLAGEMVECVIDPVIGGRFVFSDMRDGAEARHWGHYRHLERPGKLAFTWITADADSNDPSKVTLLIEPDPDGPGAVVTLQHEMLAKWADYRERTEQSWRRMLEQIDVLVAS